MLLHKSHLKSASLKSSSPFQSSCVLLNAHDLQYRCEKQIPFCIHDKSILLLGHLDAYLSLCTSSSSSPLFPFHCCPSSSSSCSSSSSSTLALLCRRRNCIIIGIDQWFSWFCSNKFCFNISRKDSNATAFLDIYMSTFTILVTQYNSRERVSH